MHLNQTSDALLLVLGGVIDIGAALQRTGVAAEIGKPSDEGIGDDLERQTREGRAVVRVTGFDLAGLGVGSRDVIDVERRRQVGDDAVQELLHALVAVGRSAEDRGQLQGNGRLADTGFELLLGDLLVHEELFGQSVVAAGDRLQKLGSCGLGLLQQVGGNIDLLHILAEVILVNGGLHGDQVDDTLEGILLADGKLDGESVGLEAISHHLHGVFKVGAVDIHLVDVGDTGNLVLIGLMPDGFGLRLDAALCAEHGDSAVQNAQGALNLDGEVHVARRIDDVDTETLPETGRGGRLNGNTSLLLLDHEVHGSSALVHFADLMGLARIEQDALGRCGLAGVDMRHDADISCME